MKLTEQEAFAIREETGLEPLPESAPAQPTLEQHFGEHTFYVADQGLFVFEPVTDAGGDGATAATDDGASQARAIQIAAWTEQDGKKSLAVIDPQPTQLVATLKAA